MSASPGDEIRKHKDPYRPVECELENDNLHIRISDKLYSYNLKLLHKGGFNCVYTVSSTTAGPIQDFVIRIAILNGKLMSERSDLHHRELSTGLLLADQGICPKIFMNLRVVLTGAPPGQDLTFGTAIERYDCSLADVQLCPILMRQVFVEGNGESLLVDLYTRAGAMVRCIDTKPDNVVVRLPKGSSEQRSGLSLALIDVDQTFCSEAVAAPDRSAIMLALGSFLHKNGAFAPLAESALAVATMSILVHVTKAALDYILYERGFGFPYIEITNSLLSNWTTVTQILDNDNSYMYGMRMSVNGSVFEMIQSYWRAVKSSELLSLRDLYDLLELMTRCRESRILSKCKINRKAGLYEKIIVLTLGYTNQKYNQKLDELRVKSESIEVWEAIVRNEPRLIPSPTARVCGSTSCTFHARSSISGFGRTRYTTTRAKKGKRSKRSKRK